MAKVKGIESLDPFTSVIDDDEVIETKTRVAKSSYPTDVDEIPTKLRINVVQPKVTEKQIVELPSKIKIDRNIKPAPPGKSIYVDEEELRIQQLVDARVNKIMSNQKSKASEVTTEEAPIYSMKSINKTTYENGNPILKDNPANQTKGKIAASELARLIALNAKVEAAKENGADEEIDDVIYAEQNSGYVVRNVDTGKLVPSVFYANRATGTVVTFVLDADDNPVNWATNKQAFPLLVKQQMNITFEKEQ